MLVKWGKISIRSKRGSRKKAAQADEEEK